LEATAIESADGPETKAVGEGAADGPAQAVTINTKVTKNTGRRTKA
jgi:hypothetical protein